jgi:hypothetical protein
MYLVYLIATDLVGLQPEQASLAQETLRRFDPFSEDTRNQIRRLI